LLCKQCGAQIKKENRRPDGLFECPGCGKVYRLKSASGTGKVPARKKNGRRGPDKRLLIGGVALLLAIVLVLVLPAGEDRVSTQPVATAQPTLEATAQPSPVPTATPEPLEPVWCISAPWATS